MEALPQRALNIALVKQMGVFVAWGLSWRIVHEGISSGWIAGPALSLVAITVVGILGLLVVYATIRFVAKCDDFQRKVHLNAFSIAAGVGFISAVTLHLAHTLSLASFAGVGVGSIAVLLFVTYIICSFVGYFRAK